MVNPKLGLKRRCTSCGKPFYDMNKDPIVCPGCGTEHKPEKLLKSAPPPPKKEEAPAKPVKAEGEEGSSILLDDEEILEEDDPDLVDDDGGDDLSGVISSPKMENEDL